MSGLSPEALDHISVRWRDIRAAAGDSELEQAYLDIAILVTALRETRAENERLQGDLNELSAWATVARGWLPRWDDDDDPTPPDTIARLEQIHSDQANRLNDGWSHPDFIAHQAYLDIWFLLDVFAPVQSLPEDEGGAR